MVQVPSASSVAVEVDVETVQIAGVVEVKPTCRPELAVAVSATPAAELMICAGITLKLIVWARRLTVTLCVTVGAAA
jgi:hypothetical protein